MVSVPNSPPVLTGADSTAKIIKEWLVDKEKTRAGMLGVDCALQIVSLKSFEHGMTQSEAGAAIGEAVRASACGVVLYRVAPEGMRPTFDNAQLGKLAQACEAVDVTLLDVLTFTSFAPKGWVSARQQGMI